MKFKLILLLCLSLTWVGCGDSGSSDSTASETEEIEGDASEASTESANSAVSTWGGHSLRDEAGKSGKWMASVSFGESMELLDASEETDGRLYQKVRLLDGKEGWVRDDLIHKGGRMAATTKFAEVYSRPSISNITDKQVPFAELVVVKQTKDEFSEFIAKNDQSNNRLRGWVLGNGILTTDEIDVAVAVMIAKARDEKDPNKRIELLNSVVTNPRYENSTFASYAMEMIEASGEKAAEMEELGPDRLRIMGDNVNVRDQPTVDGSTKLFQLFDGDVVTIVKVGNLDEIGSNTDYWYKVRTDGGKEGWVFGQFTSAAK